MRWMRPPRSSEMYNDPSGPCASPTDPCLVVAGSAPVGLAKPGTAPTRRAKKTFARGHHHQTSPPRRLVRQRTRRIEIGSLIDTHAESIDELSTQPTRYETERGAHDHESNRDR
jgi:hypothetical protein